MASQNWVLAKRYVLKYSDALLVSCTSSQHNFCSKSLSLLDLAITKSIHGTQSVCLTSLCFRCLRISEQIYSLGTVCRQAMLLACKYQRPVSLISTARLTAWVDNIAYKTGRNDQAFSWSKSTGRKCYIGTKVNLLRMVGLHADHLWVWTIDFQP